MQMIKELKAFFTGWRSKRYKTRRRLFNNPGFLNQRCCINGQLVSPESSAQVAVLSPMSGEIMGFVSSCGIAETHKAMEAARHALSLWKEAPLEHRSFFASHWADKIKENQDDLATLLTIQQGKCIAESQLEVDCAHRMMMALHDVISKKEELSEVAKRLKGDLATLEQSNAVFTSTTSDDFPIARFVKIVSLVLLSGNTLVLRAEKSTAFSSLTMASMAITCALTPGALNILTGEPDVIGPVLEKDPSLKKIITPFNRQLPYLSSAYGYPRALKAACGIVFADDNLELAVNQAAQLSFFNNGQYSLGISQLFVQKSVYDAFYNKFLAHTQNRKVGDPLDPAVQQGPLAGQEVLQLTQTFVANMVSKNATIACGGEHLGGLYYKPTVITSNNGDLDLSSEHIIGPVTVLSSFETEEDVLQRIDRNPRQCVVYLFGDNIQRLTSMTESLKTKRVVIPDDDTTMELLMEFI